MDIQNSIELENTSSSKGSLEANSSVLLHQIVEKYAIETPLATAVYFRKDSINYETLNIRANQIANYLKRKGIGHGDKVGLLLRPGLDVLPAILAIFKLNAVYVPLDADFPKNRLIVILNDTAAKIVITNSQLTDLVETLLVEVINLDQKTEISAESKENLNIECKLNSLAYVFFTSGTTGTPKGVLATVANLLHYLNSAQKNYKLNQNDIIASCARYTFSISLFELLFPISQGAAVRLVPRENIFELSKLADEISKVTVLHMGPSLLKLLLNYIDNSIDGATSFNQLRHLSSGGDMVSPEVLTLARKLFPQIEMYVIYGSSEISCMGCSWPVPEKNKIERTYVGKAFEKTKLIILDDNDQLVAPNVTGNICFSGPGVVSSYLNNQTLDNEKFFDFQGNRFYRIGDRGRIDNTGNLELLGRADFQIQLHGLRIEPAEVEFYIRQVESIKEAIVAKRTTATGSEVLVAFCVPQDNYSIDSAEISQHLKTQLPAYMHPSQYLKLEKIPLNQNLKVDRNALPKEISQSGIEQSRVGTLPETDYQIMLAEVWQELLNVKTVFLEDNFFELGGDSLLAIRLITAVEAKQGVSIYGLDIARESLGCIAQKYDNSGNSNLKTNTLNSSHHTPSNCFYFGHNKELYGVYRQAEHNSRDTSILICPPVGYEYSRCETLLSQIARTLNKKGFSTLCFDYYGTGNSDGLEVVATLDRWKQDQTEAINHLREISHNRKVIVLGVRLGATLAMESLQNDRLTEFVLWDPIINGRAHVKQMRKIHSLLFYIKAYLKSFSNKPIKTHKNELLDITYSNSCINHLNQIHKQLSIPEGSSIVATKEMRSKNHQKQLSKARIKLVDTNCHWLNTFDIDTAIYEQKLKLAIIDCILETAKC